MLTNFFLLLIIETKIIIKIEFAVSNLIFLAFFIAGLFHFISYFKVNLNKKKILPPVMKIVNQV